MSGAWLIYIRRSYKRDDAADVSDETQESVARTLVPPGASVEVIRDSGGHNSGSSDDRDGYQELIRRVREGGVAGVAVFKLDRLNRNVGLMKSLKDLLDREGVRLAAGDVPASQFDSAAGRLMFHVMIAAAEYQRDVDSERMVAQMRRTFESGGHRGNDPFGYRTARDAAGAVAKPRRLEIVPEEAAVVRRVFALLVTLPFSEVADVLNREGVRHRQPRAWTSNAVKDLYRRAEVYRGNVTTRRGAEVRPGNHDPILTEDEFAAAVAGVQNRKRAKGKRPPTSKRLYLLRGLVFCSCRNRMHGDARLARGQAWRYYLCPVAEGRRAAYDEAGNLLECDARRVPADVAERVVLAQLKERIAPSDNIAAARAELVKRLREPQPGASDRERERLETRLRKLADLYGWGDLPEGDYRRQVGEVRAALAALPTPNNKLILFDNVRAEVRAFTELVDAASGDKLQEIVPRIVERVETHDRRVVRVVPTPLARPFFADADEDGLRGAWRPRTDSNRRRRP